ncbi:hypothetical protein K6V96_08155 [Streptococcus suis]|uniref:Uncharacterized protein n=1 Tax=Streptococcus suis TaxID=1307 RepID=A0A0Z8DCA1_STRSU|nr:hypothetical protein [Streptococcus suis]MBY5015136.1 hypothetical protein [Streptococcus suis]MBY5030479.1 hypothetical protein [Streptococcus suis]MDG4509383.1 hypothetical protein [Streptococcus suis]NQH66058.1 hypothetical protein [Streptococcus suis]NQH78623.1 hypothetical protein [Streptococcus suis]
MTRTRRQKSLKALKEARLKECYSGKARFTDRISAELFVIRCQRVKKEIGERNLVRSYFCPACHAWHVTSHK